MATMIPTFRSRKAQVEARRSKKLKVRHRSGFHKLSSEGKLRHLMECQPCLDWRLEVARSANSPRGTYVEIDNILRRLG